MGKLRCAGLPEITPKMVRVGLDRFYELQEFQPDAHYTVKEIYTAMRLAEGGDTWQNPSKKPNA